MKNTKSRTVKSVRPKTTPNGSPRCLIPPRATRLQTLVALELDPGNLIDDGHALELVVDLPRIQILRGPDGFVVDEEIATELKTDGSHEYSVKHVRRIVSRELALLSLLFATVPKEFHDLLQPAFEALELADN